MPSVVSSVPDTDKDWPADIRETAPADALAAPPSRSSRGDAFELPRFLPRPLPRPGVGLYVVPSSTVRGRFSSVVPEAALEDPGPVAGDMVSRCCGARAFLSKLGLDAGAAPGAEPVCAEAADVGVVVVLTGER